MSTVLIRQPRKSLELLFKAHSIGYLHFVLELQEKACKILFCHDILRSKLSSKILQAFCTFLPDLCILETEAAAAFLNFPAKRRLIRLQSLV